MSNEKTGTQQKETKHTQPNSSQNQKSLLAAARRGDLALVQWLVTGAPKGERVEPTVLTLLGAATAGHLPIVQWLMKEVPQEMRVDPSVEFLEFLSDLGKMKAFSEEIKQWFEQTLQSKKTMTSSSSTSTAEKKEREIKHAPAGPARKLEELFPVTEVNGEILSCLPTQDILSFAGTTHSADQLVTDSEVLVERIKSDFKLNIQTLIPANRQPLLLPHARIYRHLTALNKLESQVRNRYAIDDPALFQRALSADVVELPLLYDYLDKAASVGNLALVQWLMAPERGAQRVNPAVETLRKAAELGDLALVQWLMAPERGGQRVDPNAWTLRWAAHSGNLALVQWLMAPERDAQRVNPDVETLRWAAKSGNLALVQWLMAAERGAQRVNPNGLTPRDAARSGNLALVQWLMAPERGAQRVNPDVETLRQAAMSGNLALVQWLMAPERGAQRVNPNAGTLGLAAHSGNLVLVQWLMAAERGAQRVNPDYWTPRHAAWSGNLALMQWLMASERGEQRVDPDVETLCNAAKSGNLALVRWLMAAERDAQRVNPDVETLQEAARSGNLALVQWLMALERGAQRVEPTPELLAEVRQDIYISSLIKLWLEQEALQAKNSQTAAPLSTHSISQQPPRAESKTSTQSASSSITTNTPRQADEQTETKQTQRDSSQPKKTMTSSSSSNSAAEKKERETKHAQPVPPQKLETLFPTAAINKEILSCLPTQNILSFASTTRSADQLVTESKVLVERIKSDFKLNIKTLITLMPANRRPLLLPHARIYRHLTALNKLGGRMLSNRYAIDDPALFQRALSADVVELPLLYDYLDKAAGVGNLALVQWLMAPERGEQRVSPDDQTLHSAAQSGNFALVQWLMAPERGEQRVNPDDQTLHWAAQSGNFALVQWLMAAERDAQHVNPDVETLRQAAWSGNLALVRWLMAPERGAQRVNPDVGTLGCAAESGNLALVQWLMAPERGAQRVKPTQELLFQVRVDASIRRRIKLWFEQQALQSKNSQTAAPLSTHSISQQPPRAESKTPTQSASSSITTNTPHQANEQKETKQTQRDSSRQEDAPSLAATTDSADGLAPFQKASDVAEYLRLHDELDKAARAGNLVLVQQLMMAPERGAQRVSPSVETLSYAAQSGNLALVQWLMATERGAQRVAPDADTLRSAVMSKHLALVQWLMALERSEERVDPSPELISEVKEGKLGNPAIKQWFEELFPPQKTPVAPPALTQHAKNRTQQPLSSESKPFYPAGLPDSKRISVLDSKRPVAGGVQTSSSSTSTTAFSSAVVKTGGSPLHNMGGQQTAAASSQQSRTNAGSQAGQGVTDSSLNGTGSNRLKDSQLKSPGKQGK